MEMSIMDIKINCCSEVGCFCDDISESFEEIAEEPLESAKSEN